MSAATILAELAPYLAVVVAGFLPNEFWRVLAVFASRGLAEGSDLLEWMRFVAMALVAGVVSQLLVDAPGVLAAVPLWGRIGALVFGFAVYHLVGRRLLIGLLAGESAIVLLAWGSAG